MLSDKNLQLLIEKGVECIKEERYGALANLMDAICIAVDDRESLNRLQTIRKRMPITLKKFERYYYLSQNMDGRRSFIFKDIGRVRAEQMSILYVKHVVTPLNEVAMELFGRLSRDKGTALNKFIRSRSELTKELQPFEPEVIG